MRTKQYSQVEAIVAKYRTLVSNTDAVKVLEKKMQENPFIIPEDITRLDFTEQLINRICTLKFGDSVKYNGKEWYSHAGQYYIQGLLQETEEKYLVDHFAEFIDYAFDHIVQHHAIFQIFDQPNEWSRLVPYLLENKSGEIFIPCSDYGREFAGLDNCKLTVAHGFTEASIRAAAYGLDIQKNNKKNKEELFSNFKNGQFDAAIVDAKSHREEITEDFNECLRIVKDGGDLFLCVSDEVLLSGKYASFQNTIIKGKTLQEVILLPSRNILLHCVKKLHDTIVMCDASDFSAKTNERIVDADAFIKELQKGKSVDFNGYPIIRRYSYDMITDNILLPTCYLRFPKIGTPLDCLVSIGGNLIQTDECKPEDKMVTVNDLSNVFTKSVFKVNDLSNPKLDRLRYYHKVTGPAVVMTVSEQNIAIGYTQDEKTFLVPHNLYVLKPKDDLDVRYLASFLLSDSIRKCLTMLVSGKGISARLASYWGKILLLELHTPQKQQELVQKNILEDYAAQEDFVAHQGKRFKHAIHLRKHALSQNISSFDSMFHTLEHYIKEHKGISNMRDKISPISTMTVEDTISILHSSLEIICERVDHLTDEQDWGACEAIEPQEFIEHFEIHHKNLGFQFKHLWEIFETNCFLEDVTDEETGKILFHKGDTMNAAWFPRKALQQVFENIISNAKAHGFTDQNRKDYVIQTDWTTDGLNMFIRIANNGCPLPPDVNPDLVLEYGYTTVLNQKGHGGLGGGEITEIMHKFGGDVQVISTPDKEFTVTYILTIPLASLY